MGDGGRATEGIFAGSLRDGNRPCIRAVVLIVWMMALCRGYPYHQLVSDRVVVGLGFQYYHNTTGWPDFILFPFPGRFISFLLHDWFMRIFSPPLK